MINILKTGPREKHYRKLSKIKRMEEHWDTSISDGGGRVVDRAFFC